MEDDPLLHETLHFPLDDLASLSTARLCLVQFHPEADERIRQSAELIYWRRRNRAQAIANRTQRQRTASAAVVDNNAAASSVATTATPSAQEDKVEPKEDNKQEEQVMDSNAGTEGDAMQVDAVPTESLPEPESEKQASAPIIDKQPLPSAMKKPDPKQAEVEEARRTMLEGTETPPAGLDPVQLQAWYDSRRDRQRPSPTQIELEARLAASRNAILQSQARMRAAAAEQARKPPLSTSSKIPEEKKTATSTMEKPEPPLAGAAPTVAIIAEQPPAGLDAAQLRLWHENQQLRQRPPISQSELEARRAATRNAVIQVEARMRAQAAEQPPTTPLSKMPFKAKSPITTLPKLPFKAKPKTQLAPSPAPLPALPPPLPYPRDPTEAARLFRERVDAADPRRRQGIAQAELEELRKQFFLERPPDGGSADALSASASIGSGSARLRPRPVSDTISGGSGGTSPSTGVKRTRTGDLPATTGSPATSPNKRPRPANAASTPPVVRHLQARAGDPRTIPVRFGDNITIDRLLQLQSALGNPTSIEETLDRLTMLAEEDKKQLPDYNTWCQGLLSILAHANIGENQEERNKNFAIALQALELGNRTPQEMDEELSTITGGGGGGGERRSRNRRSPAPSVSTVAARENALTVGDSALQPPAASEPMRNQRSRAPSASTVAADENANHASEYGQSPSASAGRDSAVRFRETESVIPSPDPGPPGGSETKQEEGEENKEKKEEEEEERKETMAKPEGHDTEPAEDMELDMPAVKPEPKQEEESTLSNELRPGMLLPATFQRPGSEPVEVTVRVTDDGFEMTDSSVRQVFSSSSSHTDSNESRSTTRGPVISSLIADSRASTPAAAAGPMSRSSSPAEIKPKLPTQMLSDMTCLFVSPIPTNVTYEQVLSWIYRTTTFAPGGSKPVAVCQLMKTGDNKAQYTRLYFAKAEDMARFVEQRKNTSILPGGESVTMIVVKNKPKKANILWTDIMPWAKEMMLEKGWKLGLSGLPESSTSSASGNHTENGNGSASAASASRTASTARAPTSATAENAAAAETPRLSLADRLRAEREASNNESRVQEGSRGPTSTDHSAASPSAKQADPLVQAREMTVGGGSTDHAGTSSERKTPIFIAGRMPTDSASSATMNTARTEEPVSQASPATGEIPTGPRNPTTARPASRPSISAQANLPSGAAQNARANAAASFAARIESDTVPSSSSNNTNSTTSTPITRPPQKRKRSDSTNAAPASNNSLESTPRNPLLTRLSPSATPSASSNNATSNNSTNTPPSQPRAAAPPSLLDRFGATPAASSSSPPTAGAARQRNASQRSTSGGSSTGEGLLSRLD